MAVAWAVWVAVAWWGRCGGGCGGHDVMFGDISFNNIRVGGHGLMLSDISFNIVWGGSAKGLDLR